MAEGTIKIKEMEELTELTDNDYFVVDNLQSGVPTKKYKATRVIQMIENVADEIEEKITPSIDTALAVGSASGDIATFSDGSALPMPKLQVAIEPQQDLHGYDSPWVGGSGKNKLQVTATTQTISGITFTVNSDGTLVLNGTSTTDVYFRMSVNMDLQISETIKYSVTSTNNTLFNNFGFDKKDSTIQDTSIAPLGNDITVNNPNNTKTCWIHLKNGTNYSNVIVYPMIRLATETDATFAPYSNICPISGFTEANVVVSPTTDAEDGTTYNIQFKNGDNPLTVYGGTLDVVSGVLTVDRVGVDLSSVSFTYDSSNKRWSRQFSDMKNYTARSADLMFEQYQATTSAYTGDTGTAFAYGQNIYIYDAEQSLTISGKCVYELATPQTIQLTPTQVKSLLGSNNVWADTGKIIDCEYKRDATAIINSLIARIEALENQ